MRVQVFYDTLIIEQGVTRPSSNLKNNHPVTSGWAGTSWLISNKPSIWHLIMKSLTREITKGKRVIQVGQT